MFHYLWVYCLDNFTSDLPNCKSTHQKRSEDGRVYIYIQISISFVIRFDLSINLDAESITLEIVSENLCNTIVNVLYELPKAHFEPFQNFFRIFFLNAKRSSKNIMLQKISILTY